MTIVVDNLSEVIMQAAQIPDVSPPWRVVVLTTIPNGIVYSVTDAVLREFGHRVVGVVTTPGPESRRSTDYLSVVEAVRPGVDVLVSTHPARWAAMLAPLKPDLIVCCGMPYRIPQDVVDLARLGAINVHPSMLPRHRGPWPLHWTFRNGDAEAGITVHRITPEFDTGPILAQATVPIDDDDDGMSVMGKLIPQAAQLLGVAFARIANGDIGEPQDESGATYAGFFEDEWRTIDWPRDARTIHNQIRSWTGVSGGPQGALAIVDGEQVVITKTRLLASAEGTGATAMSGSVIERREGEVVVQCGDGAIAVTAMEPVAKG